MSELPTDDPRTTGEYTRRSRGHSATGTVILLGVVHDHPASIYRVQKRVEALEPDVLALELSPIAVPLFEQYASVEQTPPVLGGEMSAAIQTASCDRIVGIDGPSTRFLGRLLHTLLREEGSPAAISAVSKRAASVTKYALLCRLAAHLAAATGMRVEVGGSTSHDCTRRDEPAVQAAEEHRQIRQAETLLETLSRSDASTYRARAREAHMVNRLSALRADGDVAAVIGVGHLDAVADRLD
jgi:pheromone shutdown protein TraB